ncbi:MAG: biotin--[acetyl-CoA-carboxylase] ligase, partial [Chitinophagaceae bacterium]|nr:biotin--[acetyl-CoA-carboxylase] ligase [Chitinophagaceae bacterium]
YDFFKDWAGPDMTRIKWPNDLYWQDRKAGGILIESISGSAGPDKSLLFAVGIGININQTIFDPKVRNPVSLKQITGKTYDIVELGKTLCKHLEKWYHAPVEDVHAAYNAVLFRRGGRVRLRKDLIVFDTTIVGVSPSGHLVTQDPLEREFLNGEVEWLLDPPSPIQ